MKIKNNYKRIFLLLIMVVVVCTMFTSVEARTISGWTGREPSKAEEIINEIGKLVSVVGLPAALLGVTSAASAGLATAPVSIAGIGLVWVVNGVIILLTIVIYLALWAILGIFTQNWATPPMADNFVFNRFAFLDANFINPAKNSLLAGMGSVPSNLFNSFVAIGTTIFLIAAMVAGLRMAMSSIAAKKAVYKEAALKWLTGFLIMISLKWIIAGAFFINEEIVHKLSDIVMQQEIRIHLVEVVPILGNIADAILQLADAYWGTSITKATSLTVPGGLIAIWFQSMIKALGGDIVASIVGFILIGQCMVVFCSYLKRVFMCFFLGVVSPLVVAVGTIMTSMGQKSTITTHWFKGFFLTVFMQSIHALYMLVVLTILSQWSKGIPEPNADAAFFQVWFISIITVVLITGLIKLEKLVKSTFGIGDSYAGDLKAGAKSMLKAMGAVKGIQAGAKAIGDNVGKLNDAHKRRTKYTSDLNNLRGTKEHSLAMEAYKEAAKAKNANNDAKFNEWRKKGDRHKEAAKGYGIIYGKDGMPINLNTKVQKDKDGNVMSIDERIEEARAGKNKAAADYSSAKFATFMGPANLAAGVGIGIGVSDELSESVFKGGYITAGLDAGAERVGRMFAKTEGREPYVHQKEGGGSHGAQPGGPTTNNTSVNVHITNNRSRNRQWKKYGKSG